MKSVNFANLILLLAFAAVLALLVPPVGTASAEVFLQGNYVEVGINDAGSFGTSGGAPAGFHPKPGTIETGISSRALGFVADPGKDGWDVGTPPQTGDYFIPGKPEEGWMVQWTSSDTLLKHPFPNFGLMGEVAVPKTSLVDTSSGDTKSAVWSGVASSGSDQLQITQSVSFHSNDLFFTMNVVLTNSGTTTLKSLEYMRNVDPDQEEALTGSYATSNFVEFQPPRSGVSGRPDLAAIPAGNTTKALTVAKGTTYGLTLGLGTIDNRAVVAASQGFSNRDPDAILNTPNQPLQTSPDLADNAIALAYDLGDLAPGQSTTITYAYILNDADLATAMAGLGAVTILQPTGTVSGNNVIFQATTDNVANTTKVDFYVNGVLVTTSTTPDAGGVFSATFDSTQFPNGNLALKAVATFASTTAEKSTTVTVDNAGPPITFSAPTTGQIFSGGVAIPISVTVLDPAHPPVRISFFRETASTGSQYLGQVTTAPFTSSFTVSGLPIGETVVIKAVANDSLDRTTTLSVSGAVRSIFVVSFNSNGGSAVNSQNISNGTTATAPSAPIRTGYSLVGWYTDNALTTAFDFTIPITGDLTLYAKWSINQYNVNFAYGANGSLTGSASQTVNYGGSTSAVTAVPASGYFFVNWTDGGGSVISYNNPLTVSNVTASQEVKANFAIDLPLLTVTSPSIGTMTDQMSYVVQGTATYADQVVVTVNGGAPITVTPAASTGAFSVPITFTDEKVYAVTVMAWNATGSVEVTRNIIYSTITIVDALRAYKIAMGYLLPTASDLTTLDVAPEVNGKPKGDGVIDIADVILLLRKGTGLDWNPSP